MLLLRFNLSPGSGLFREKDRKQTFPFVFSHKDRCSPSNDRIIYTACGP